MQHLIKQLDEHTNLYRDRDSGIAYIRDGHTGLGHSCHPSIDASGSVSGMIKTGRWPKTAKPVQVGGFIYNISCVTVTDELDKVAQQYCECETCRKRSTKVD